MAVVRFAEELETTIVLGSSTCNNDNNTSAAEDVETARRGAATARRKNNKSKPQWKWIYIAVLTCVCGAVVLTVLLWRSATLDRDKNDEGSNGDKNNNKNDDNQNDQIFYQGPVEWQLYGQEITTHYNINNNETSNDIQINSNSHAAFSHVALSADARTLVVTNATHVQIYRLRQQIQTDEPNGKVNNDDVDATILTWQVAATFVIAAEEEQAISTTESEPEIDDHNNSITVVNGTAAVDVNVDTQSATTTAFFSSTTALSLAGDGRRLAISTTHNTVGPDDKLLPRTRFYDDSRGGTWSLRPGYLGASDSLALDFSGRILAAADQKAAGTQTWQWTFATSNWTPLTGFVEAPPSSPSPDGDGDGSSSSSTNGGGVAMHVKLAASGKTLVERSSKLQARVWEYREQRRGNHNGHANKDDSVSFWARQGQALPMDASLAAANMAVSADGQVVAVVQGALVAVYDWAQATLQWQGRKLIPVLASATGGMVLDVCTSSSGETVGLITDTGYAQLWQWDGTDWHRIHSNSDYTLLQAPVTSSTSSLSSSTSWRSISCSAMGHVLVLHGDDLVRVVQVAPKEEPAQRKRNLGE